MTDVQIGVTMGAVYLVGYFGAAVITAAWWFRNDRECWQYVLIAMVWALIWPVVALFLSLFWLIRGTARRVESQWHSILS